MKKSVMISIIVVMLVVLAMPALAQRGFGRQQDRKGPGTQQGQDFENVKICQEAWDEHMKDTEPLRNEIMTQQQEIESLLANPETKLEELLKKQGELQKLTNELQNKGLTFKWNFYKDHPEISPDMCRGCFGPGAGGGGGAMGPGGRQGSGPGMRGPGGGQSSGPGMRESGGGQNY